MLRLHLERRRDDRAAQIHFRAHRVQRQFRQHRMAHGVGADGDERIGGERGELRPAHAKLLAERRDIDVVAGREIIDGAAHVRFARPRPQPPIKLVVKRALCRDRGAVERVIAAVDLQADMIVARDHRLER